MAVKETVIFMYSMSFWNKVEVNTEILFEFKGFMNNSVPYYLPPACIFFHNSMSAADPSSSKELPSLTLSPHAI